MVVVSDLIWNTNTISLFILDSKLTLISADCSGHENDQEEEPKNGEAAAPDGAAAPPRDQNRGQGGRKSGPKGNQLK